MRKLSRKAVVGVRLRGCLLLRVARQLTPPSGNGSRASTYEARSFPHKRSSSRPEINART